MIKSFILGITAGFFSFQVAWGAETLLQKKNGFVGYIEAGTTVEIKTVNGDSQTLNVVTPENKEAGLLQVTFRNFERALGGNKKVEFLNKSQSLAGKTFVLKYNLVLLPL